MNDYLQKIKTWYGKIKTRKVSYDKPGIRPSADWKMMLVLSFCILCVLGLAAGYFYYKISNGELFMSQQDATAKDAEIDMVLLKKTVADIKAKQDFINQLESSGNKPGDPSI